MNMEKLKFPFTVEELPEDLKKQSDCLGGFDLVKVGNTTVPRRILKYGEEIYNFKPRPDDIWVVGYPRSGTTLTQEIIYILANDFDYEKAASKVMDDRFPFLEDVLMRPEEFEAKYVEFCKKNKEPETPEEFACLPKHKILERTKERRFIKCHQGFSFIHPQLLETGCKVVFIARNFKDCFVSTFFFPLDYEKKKEFGLYRTWKLQEKDIAIMGDYMTLLKDAWERRHSKNLLFLIYEEVNKDKRAAILKIANFLGKEITEEQLQTLLDHVDIKKFRENKSVNNDHLVTSGIYVKNEKSSFIRKGNTGGWRENFTKEMNEEVNAWLLKKFKEIPDFEIPQCWKEAMDL